MPLIDSTYFRDSNIIANVGEPGVNININDELNHHIQIGERDVLSFAFGWEMWEDFKQYIGNGQLLPEAPQNYQDIVNGKQYEREGKKCYWLGLIQPATKESLLADYVYCTYRNENNTQTTGTGEAKISSKVGQSVSMTPKITKVWNKFIEKLHGSFRSNPSGFTPEGKPFWIYNGGVDYYGVYPKDGVVSLVQFLFDNKADYPLLDFNYRRFGEYKNEFGL